MADEKKGVEGRRDFLKLASLGTVLGGAALATGGKAHASQISTETESGYRETTHVKAYYNTARF